MSSTVLFCASQFVFCSPALGYCVRKPQEPYEGAWLQEGDVVEAIYNSYSGGTYYHAGCNARLSYSSP